MPEAERTLPFAKYDQSKLHGRIIEKCGSIEKFAELFGTSGNAVRNLLKGKNDWSRRNIERACEILDVNNPYEIHLLFFSVKSSQK